LKLFSKTPLKNVKKYNIMVAIIGAFVKIGNLFAKLYAPLTDKILTTQGDFYYE